MELGEGLETKAFLWARDEDILPRKDPTVFYLVSRRKKEADGNDYLVCFNSTNILEDVFFVFVNFFKSGKSESCTCFTAHVKN